MFFLVRYIGEKNAERHPLEQKRILLTGSQNPTKKDISPWWDFALGCFSTVLLIGLFFRLEKPSDHWPFLIFLGVSGLSCFWRFIKEKKSEKT